MLNRRQLLALGSAGLVLPAGLFLPRSVGALGAGVDRKFLFIYANGGWDPLQVFAPAMGATHIETQAGSTQARENGVTFVDHEERPSVRSFFETHGKRACVINGIEVRSVTHERCRQLLFTGGSSASADDWGLTIASNSLAEYAAPHLVFSGPAFAAKYAANAVRSGEVGQLTELLDGSALARSTLPIRAPSSWAEEREEAYLRQRIADFSDAAQAGSAAKFGRAYQAAMDNLEKLRAVGNLVDLDPDQSGCRRDIAADAACALNAFELGLSRCALTKDNGWCSITWDTHSNNDLYQSRSFEELFGYLNALMADLDSRTGLSGAPLSEEVTVVVFSEMGRHPQYSGGGRSHWTFTSAMLIGSGVRGGQVVGQYNDSFEGEPIDLDSGEVSDAGVSLLPDHLGATLLELAGVDPAEHLAQGRPIRAVIDQ